MKLSVECERCGCDYAVHAVLRGSPDSKLYGLEVWWDELECPHCKTCPDCDGTGETHQTLGSQRIFAECKLCGGDGWLPVFRP